jgi:monovalent cation:H+ antiporter-2, CPA2 family
VHSSADYLSDILIFLSAAVVVVAFFRWFKASPILGYLFAGLAIGPYALGIIDDIEGTKTLGDFGVVFLMFTIGLKMPFQRLRILRRYVFGLGAAQVVITATLLAGIATLLSIPPKEAVLVGTVLALSSTAVGLQVLAERGETASRFGRVSFAILLFQDLAVVLLLVLIVSLNQEGQSLGALLGVALVKAVGALLTIVLTGRVLLRPIYRLIASLKNQELFVAMNLLVVLATGLLTSLAGLSMELGAFLAGLLLSETEYRHQVEADIQPFYGLLLGLFFMTVGMTIDVGLLGERLQEILLITFSLLVLKMILLVGLSRLFNLSWGSALRVGFLLAGGGEFIFVIFEPAVEAGVLSPEVSALLYVSVALSMGINPLLSILGKYLGDRISAGENEANLSGAASEVEDLRNHVIIAGFGRVGKLMAQLFTKQMIPFVIIDNDMAKVSEGRARGFPVFFGDARRAMVMRTIGAEKARTVVVSLDEQQAAMRAAMMLRRNFPSVDVCARMRDNTYEAKLAQAGVTVVMPENLEPTLQLTSAALKAMETPLDEVNQVIANFREQEKNPGPSLEGLPSNLSEGAVDSEPEKSPDSSLVSTSPSSNIDTFSEKEETIAPEKRLSS